MIVVYNYYDNMIPYSTIWISVYEEANFKFHSVDDLYQQLNYNGVLLVFYNTEQIGAFVEMHFL